MQFSQHLLGPVLYAVCAVMVLAAAGLYWAAALGSALTVPRAALRAVVQLAAVAAVLATALRTLWNLASGAGGDVRGRGDHRRPA